MAWNLYVAGIPEEEWWRYVPKGTLQWKRVPIRDDRSGPLKSVKCAPNLAAAVRAAETFQEVVSKALANPKSCRWRKALAQLVDSRHCCIEATEVTIGS